MPEGTKPMHSILARLLLLVIAAALGFAVAHAADYVKVEVRGTLNTGVMAIGGESTGTIITVGPVVWELEVPAEAPAAQRLQALDGAEVVVTGVYRQQEGVEIPIRHIVTVDSIRLPVD